MMNMNKRSKKKIEKVETQVEELIPCRICKKGYDPYKKYKCSLWYDLCDDCEYEWGDDGYHK